ncbi:MAG TPA: S1C family serine protease [Skermanella sp.]|nr:S1C family serine protease [Skermanella sp.]
MASIRLWITLWIGLCVLPLAGCGVNVRKTEIAEPLTPPAEARPVPIRFGELQAKLRRGDRIGGYVIGFTCLGPFDPITWTTGREMMDRSDVADMFHEELSAAGYDVTGNPGRLFEREEDEERAELVVSAQVTDVKMNVCRKMGWWLIESDVIGEEVEASVKVDWTVYSRLERRMVLRTSTRGYTDSGSATEDGKILALEQAMAGAIANLAADPDFRAAAFAARDADLSVPALERGGGIGGGTGSSRRPPVDNTVSDARLKPMPTALLVDDAAKLQSVRLPPVPAFTTPIQDHVERVTGAAVLVASGTGHGSGVLVGKDGLVLTNYHVVGNSERVRVVLDDGTALTGVVERRHKIRDVALVLIEGGRFAPLPVRATPLTVSEEVYAVGAPLQERLRGTVTRGIVSAFRRDRLTGLETIQADVSIQGGNSGGPLVDAQGNLAGLAVAGYVVPGGAGSAGLNLFIPIADALDRLRLEIADR